MATYINRRRYVTVPDKTTVNVRALPGGSVLYRLFHGTPVKLVPSKETTNCYFVIAWEPAARNGYVLKSYITATDNEPSNPRNWETQLFGSSNLSKGASGPNVFNLQYYLNEFGGANLSCDGSFGTQTENAVKAFQSSSGLTVDGIVGNATKSALATERLPNDFFNYEN